MPEFTVWGAAGVDRWFSVVARIIPLLIIGEFFMIFLVRRHRANWKDFFNNVSNGLIHRYVNLLIWTPAYFLLHGFLFEYALFDIEISSVTPWVVVFVATDFIYYWFHRLMHRIPLFWTFHESHHSSPYVNWLSAFRLNWLIGSLRAVSHIPLTLIGVNPQVTYFCYIFVLVYQIFIHSEYMNFPKGFQGFLNTPSLHRLHHSKLHEHHDTNFGGVFIIWDKIFGTYTAPLPAKTVIPFGVQEHDGMRNPFYLNFAPIYGLLQQSFSQPSFRAAMAVLWLKADPRPTKTEETLPTQRAPMRPPTPAPPIARPS